MTDSSSSPFTPEQNPYQAPSAPIASSSSAAAGTWATVRVIEILAQTRLWVMLISIVGLILSGLMIVGGVFAAVVMALMGGVGPVEAAIILVVYPVIGLVYLIPSIFLFRFGQRIRDLRFSHNVADLEAALTAQKSFWKFCGIFLAFVIALYLGAGAIAMVIAVLSGR